MVKHSLLEEYLNSIFLFLPPYKDVGTMVLLPLFFLAWSFGGIIGMPNLLSGKVYELNPSRSPIFLTLFLLVWLICWALAEMYIIYVIARMYFGQEIVEITESSFIVRQQVFGFSNERVYHLTALWNLRTIPKEPMTPFKNRYKPWNGQGDHTLAFDYHLGTVRFGAGISETKAAKILEIVQEKFPNYKTRDQLPNNHWHTGRKNVTE
jgi:hypothetical protein